MRKKSPNNIFTEKDMYTIQNKDGSRNLKLEKGLSELETRFSTIRDQKFKRRVSLTNEELFVLCAFVAAMHARTKARREHHAAIWNRVLGQRNRLAEKISKMSAEERKKIRPEPRGLLPRVTIPPDKIEQWAKTPLQSWLMAEVTTLTPILSQLDLLLLETGDQTGFITSDNPCVWFDPKWHTRPPFYQSPSLMYETIEITFPLSPQFMLLFNRKGSRGHIRVGQKALDEFNKRTRFLAHEHFIVNSNVKRAEWFDAGVEPEDSWEKQHKADSDVHDD